ncbi:unnamed protein product [Malus baccata var. baccata]
MSEQGIFVSPLSVNRAPDDLGQSSNTLDGGHRSITTEKWPKIGPQRHQSKIFFPTWDIIFVVSSAFSLFVDPLICYIPFVVEKDACFLWDLQLMWIFLALRSIGDLFYYMDIVVFLKRFHTERSAKSSTWAYAKTNDDRLVTTVRKFIHKKPIRFLAILGRIWVALPFLQALLLIGRYTYFDNSKLVSVIPFQYILRAYNHYKWLDRRANIETVRRRFLKAILDFLPFIIASHGKHMTILNRSKSMFTSSLRAILFEGCETLIINYIVVFVLQLYGSLWYFFAVDRKIICWQDYICKHGQICDYHIYSFYCGPTSQTYNGRINIPSLKLSCSCSEETPCNRTSKYGIYVSALQSNLSTSKYLPRKMLQCFWWGLRNLSSFGSNLETSFDTAQIIFSAVISISGVILFLVYLNSRVQVPIIGSIDEKGLKAISERLKPVIYNADVYIIREGEPLRKMLFIWRGTTLTYTTTKGATNVCKCLEKNDFYGEQLVIWALKSATFSELPICTTTLVSQSKVEAFSITANDLKSVVAKFWLHFRRDLPHSQPGAATTQKAKRSTGWDKWSVLQHLPSIHVAWRRHHSKELRDQLAGTNMYFELVSLLFWSLFLKKKKLKNQKWSEASRTLRKPKERPRAYRKEMRLLPLRDRRCQRRYGNREWTSWRRVKSSSVTLQLTILSMPSISVGLAEKAAWNSLGIFEVPNISGKKRELVPAKAADDDSNMHSEDSDSDDDSEDEESGGSGAPVLQAIFFYIPQLIQLTFIFLNFYLISVPFHFLLFMYSCAR